MKSLLRNFFSLAVIIGSAFMMNAQTPDSTESKVVFIYKNLAAGTRGNLYALPQEKSLGHMRSYQCFSFRADKKGIDSVSLLVSVDDSLHRLFVSEQHKMPHENGVAHTFSFNAKGTLEYAGTDDGSMEVYDEIDFSEKNFSRTLYQKYLPHINNTIDELFKKIKS